VPQLHKEGKFQLGAWVANQRTKKALLSEKRRRRLNELGFIWERRSDQWEEGFSYLKLYKERDGHCRVPAKYKEGDYRLGRWVHVQRANQAKLPAERRQRLDELGFFWRLK
jgi:hypothetical protein